MDDLDDLAMLRKKALESRKKEYEHDELRLHPDEDLEMSYAARKKSARKKVAKRKSTKEASKKVEETPKGKDEPVAHFINPHGGFMPYSTLSLAVKRTSDMGHLSPISSDSPSPVNLNVTEERLKALEVAAAASRSKPNETKLPPATEKPVVQAKPVAPATVKSTTKPDTVDKGRKEQAVSSKPASEAKERQSRSRSSSSASTSSFSSSSASSFSSKSSSSQRRKKRRHSSSSSSSSQSSSSLSTSSSSSSSSRSRRSSSSSSGSGSRKHKHRSRRHSSKDRQSHRRYSAERDYDNSHSRMRRGDRDDDDGGRRHFVRGPSRFISQRGRGRGDFNRPGGFQRDRNYPDGDRPRFIQREPQDYRRDVRIQRPFNRPSFGRGRQNFRPSFNPPQFRNVIVRSRGRDFRNQQQRPFGERPFGERFRPDFQSDHRRPNDRFTNKRYREDESPEHDRQRRRIHSESSDHHHSSRAEQRGSRSNYESKIGAPIKESRDPVERRPRSYSGSNHSRHSDNRSSPRRPRSPVKSTGSGKSVDEEMEPELELQPESDLELEPSRIEIDALLENPDYLPDTRVSNKRSDAGRSKKRAASSSSSSSGSSSSGSSSSASSPGRSQKINSPIRVSPERRDYKSKQGAVIRRNDENSHHTRPQGQKRFFTESATSLEKVSKRLRPDLAQRLGPDPNLAQQQEEFVPSRQRFYNNNSGPARGDALEIARQFRLQKKQATRKVSVSNVSKSVSVNTDVAEKLPSKEEKVKEVDPEKEKELNDRIQKIKEQNEKILERKKMIEDDIELYA